MTRSFIMTTIRITLLSLLVLISISLTACGEPDRAEYRNMAADEVCNELDSCGNIGSGEQYDTYDDCIVEEESRFNSAWPANECEDRINADKFDNCMTRAKLAACGSWLDYLAALDHCSADNVCIGTD